MLTSGEEAGQRLEELVLGVADRESAAEDGRTANPPEQRLLASPEFRSLFASLAQRSEVRIGA